MVSPAIAPMLTSRKIKVLHLEPTDVCQAACPQCSRETDYSFCKTLQHHLRWEQITQHCDHDFIAGLEKMFMCGNYGDPAAGHYTLDIFRKFRNINADIVLGMNTNGALQDHTWWQELAEILCQSRDYVVFSIDGLEQTNAIYRRNVDWKRLMRNVEVFISHGGCAHWDMLVFQHNEHQVEQCQRLARDLGFTWFRAKVTKRKLLGDLQTPLNWSAPRSTTGEIDCHALQEQSLYIDAQGRVSPCCWLGNRQNNFVTDFSKIKQSWKSDHVNPVCARNCSRSESGTVFSDQWKMEIALC